jgi:HAD superfamily hydrolase (TIGR01509 family)
MCPPVLESILWDVDGTLAETERDGHLKAFNQAFEALGVPWRWSEQHYGELLAVAGGRERLLHDMQGRVDAPRASRERQALAEQVHHLKNALYADIVSRGDLPLRDGVRELLNDCERAGMRMGIVTTTSRTNVEALMTIHVGKDWESRFATVITAREAPKKKPDPQAYSLALEALDLSSREVVAIEDAPAGITAARSAGLALIVTRSHYFPSPESRGALAVGPSLGNTLGWHPAAEPAATRIGLEQIMQWLAPSH